MDDMRRYVITIARADGTVWREVHLWATSPDDATARTQRWIRIELRDSTYRATDARLA